MCDLMNVPFDDETDIQNAIRDVMKETWKYSQTYSIGRFCCLINFNLLLKSVFFFSRKPKSGH